MELHKARRTYQRQELRTIPLGLGPGRCQTNHQQQALMFHQRREKSDEAQDQVTRKKDSCKTNLEHYRIDRQASPQTLGLLRDFQRLVPGLFIASAKELNYK